MPAVSQIAKYAVDLCFEKIPAEVQHAAKRLLADKIDPGPPAGPADRPSVKTLLTARSGHSGGVDA